MQIHQTRAVFLHFNVTTEVPVDSGGKENHRVSKQNSYLV